VEGVGVDSPEHRRRGVREYFELEAPDERITHLERVASERVMGEEYDVWDVHTDQGRWWVVSNLMNLYTQADFKSMDVVLSFHIGLMERMKARSQQRVPPRNDRLTAAWRRLEQASDALEKADEAEEFQSVGMRCRECLLTFVQEVARLELPTESPSMTPQSGNFIAWMELLADAVAAGASAAHRRSYLKVVASETWQYVQWLTHARNATRHDALMAIVFTDHIVSTFGVALNRWEHGVPDRCPDCGSYRLYADWRHDDDDEPGVYVTLCESCGWESEPQPTAATVDDAPRQAVTSTPEGECTPSSDIQTTMTPDDLNR
jgi:hypothetical protein